MDKLSSSRIWVLKRDAEILAVHLRDQKSNDAKLAERLHVRLEELERDIKLLELARLIPDPPESTASPT